jgi:drug/metabolite transporter (DMT)-like permease
MHWIIVTLFAPFFWSLLNYADKYLISKYAREAGIVGLLIFSSLFALLATPIIYFFEPTVIAIEPTQMLALMGTGLLIAFGILLYLYALVQDHASHVVPFWFLVPILGYIFGLVFLQEHIETSKVIGSLITVFGALILSLEFEEKITFKKKVVLLMFGSSILLALSDVSFKGLIPEGSFWTSIFWNQLGFGLFGIFCFTLIKRYRKEFYLLCSTKSKELIILNVSTEIATVIATVINYYSMTLAPIALILVISYTAQPLFVFLEGVVITRFFPHIHTERLSKKHIVQKVGAIAIMAVGTYFVIGI